MPEQVTPGGQGEYNLAGRAAVVTGGSGGIGEATCRRLASEGASVVIGFRTARDRAEAIRASLPGPGKHLAIGIPVEDSAAIKIAADHVEREFGMIHVLVNAAGVTRSIPHADLDALDDKSFDQIMITNVRGPFASIRAFAPLLRRAGDSIIVNVSSISASTGLGSSIAYCASKAALDTLGLSLARVMAPEVRVIGVSPAAVATDFVPGRGREGVERQAATTPLRRVAEPEDVAMAILAAISHLRLTTGSTIVVDGGRHL